MDHAVLVEEPERAIQPLLAPPLPSEALALSGPRQVAPNLLLYPVADIREAPAGVAMWFWRRKVFIMDWRPLLTPTPSRGRRRCSCGAR
jgi:hypothetical protein